MQHCATAIPAEDVAEVRRRILLWAGEFGVSYLEISRRSGLSHDQVKRFMAAISCNDVVLAKLVAHLPIGLHYQGPRITPR